MEALEGEIRIVFLASDSDEHDDDEVTLTIGLEFPKNLTMDDVRLTLQAVLDGMEG